jgi:hypothetical protein
MMPRGFAVLGLLVGAFVAAAVPSHAVDPWEGGSTGDDQPSHNVIGHGGTQVHDLQETSGNDVDWIAVPTLSGHSYEARISGSSFAFDAGSCSACPQFERVSDAGALLSEDQAVVNEGLSPESYERTIRWMSGQNTTRHYVRVTGGQNAAENASHVYTLRFWETTYPVPRWSNATGQSTVFQITNLGQLPAYVGVNFYTANGADLFAVVKLVSRNQSWILDTSQYAPLAGATGSALITHTAGYGGLAGKVVTVEPATGILFETPLLPIPD